MRIKVHLDHGIHDYVLGPLDHMDIRDGLVHVFQGNQCAPVATFATKFVLYIEIVDFVGPEVPKMIPVMHLRSKT